MSKVEWKRLLPSNVNVLFSSLEDPNTCDDLDRDVVCLQLPGGIGIDVEWRDDDKEFAVRLFDGSFHNCIVKAKAATSADVIELAKDWSKDYASQTAFDSQRVRTATESEYIRSTVAAW